MLSAMWKSGVNWNNWDAYIGKGYYGTMGDRGYVLPETMWCSVVVARNWKLYSSSYAGSLKARERTFFRSQALGYHFFMGTVGCPARNPGHIGLGTDTPTEEPFRPATGNRHIRAAHMPSAWIACCPIDPNAGRKETGHFFLKMGLGYRFNVLHLDGHVFTHAWQSPYTNSLYASWSASQPWNYNKLIYGGVEDKSQAYGFDKNE
jgi:prepilin-type processing-associated H-X9-DG protein